MANNKLVTASGLQAVLKKIKDWLPFIKLNGRMHIPNPVGEGEHVVFSVGDKGNNNIFKVYSNGKIYILDTEDADTPKSLQEFLNKRDNFIIQNQNDWDAQSSNILKKENFGAIVQLEETIKIDEIDYIPGMYIISQISMDSYILSKLATTISTGESDHDAIARLDTKVQAINKWIADNRIPNQEIDEIAKSK